MSDALVINPNNNEISSTLLFKLFQVAISCSEDNDRVKTNGVRALGNLLQLVDTILLQDQRFEEITARACTVLTHHANSASNMKVRWNACYALGNVLRNHYLFANKSILFKRMFTVLMDLVVGFKNFKVRINAALALSAPRAREQYGDSFIMIWITLMKALETSQSIEDFTEYKHRDLLVEQVWYT